LTVHEAKVNPHYKKGRIWDMEAALTSRPIGKKVEVVNHNYRA